jgi:hypothetical protein
MTYIELNNHTAHTFKGSSFVNDMSTRYLSEKTEDKLLRKGIRE